MSYCPGRQPEVPARFSSERGTALTAELRAPLDYQTEYGPGRLSRPDRRGVTCAGQGGPPTVPKTRGCSGFLSFQVLP